MVACRLVGLSDRGHEDTRQRSNEASLSAFPGPCMEQFSGFVSECCGASWGSFGRGFKLLSPVLFAVYSGGIALAWDITCLCFSIGECWRTL